MKKKKISYSLKRKIHLINNYTCQYCGEKAAKIINGLAFGYNPRYEVEKLLEWEKEQSGKPSSILDVDIFITFEIDHIYPESRGGKTAQSNLTLSCRLCNRKKGCEV